MISLKQLRYFVAVARLGHFGKAAEFCNVTQPALSMQVRDLERNLGLQLLERRQDGVYLTQAGREIRQRSRNIIAAVQDLDDYARHHDRLLSGTLRLGVIPSLAPYILPPLLPVLRDQFGKLDLRIRETQTELLVDELIAGQLDVLLLALPIDHAEVTTLDLFEDKFLLAAPANWPELPKRRPTSRRGHLKASKVRARIDMIKDGRLLLLEEGHCLRDQARQFCQMRQIDNLDTFGASTLSTIVQMVINGMGLTLLPEISVPVESRHGAFELMRFEPPEPSRTVGLAWRASSPRQTDFLALGEQVRQVARTGQQPQ